MVDMGRMAMMERMTVDQQTATTQQTALTQQAAMPFTVFVSTLELDTQSRAAKGWVANPYRVHQRVLMAFPDGYRSRVLWRSDPGRLIVQAPDRGDWARAFDGPSVFPVVRKVVQRCVTARCPAGARLAFVLRANPTKRCSSTGARIGLYAESEQRAWLERKARAGGFEILDVEVTRGGMVQSRRNPVADPVAHVHWAVDFAGRLEVVDEDAFARTLSSGIGAAKGYGFGLLLVEGVHQ